jgi:hypothetical protein
MTDESIFSGGIRQFYRIDVVFTDCGFYFRRRIRLVDHNQVLDRIIALIGYTLDCTQDAWITRRRSNHRYERLHIIHQTAIDRSEVTMSDSLLVIREIAAGRKANT